MNLQQRKYAMERVTAIKNARSTALRTQHDALRRTASPEDRVAFIRSGKAKLRSGVGAIHGYTDVCDVFDFSEIEGFTPEQLAAHAKANAELEAEATRVRDQIMLGDSETAIGLLTAFASGTAE